MPADRVRTPNAQGRQKSCSECVAAKRKCDLQKPNCLRCTRQRLGCTYPSQPRNRTSALTLPDSGETPPVSDSFDDPILGLPFDLDAQDPATVLNVEPLQPIPDFSMSISDLEQVNNVELFERTETLPVPSSAKSLSTLISSELFESRVGYSMELWKQTPRMMVEKNCTPWSHPNLYAESMPRSMQDAFAACSLFISRTETNSRFVLRHITDHANELIGYPIPSLPAELIARAHATLLYQVMLICSNDFRYFNQTQTLLTHMKDLSSSLQALVLQDQSKHEDYTGLLPLYPSAAAREAWLSFIFRESCRRTFLAVCHAVSICAILQNDAYSCNHGTAIGNRVTLSSALWEAKSPLEFVIAWNQKNHYLVKDMDFTEMLNSADADEVDAFGRMLLVGLLGKDDVSGWLHSKGGKL